MNWNLIPSNNEDETITNVFHKNHHFKLTPDAPVTTQIIFVFVNFTYLLY